MSVSTPASTPAVALDTRWPVVVLNTHYSGLAIARSLGRKGVRILGLTAYPEFPGNASRYLEYRPSADSLHAPEALLEQLVNLADELPLQAVLLPTRDHDVNFINGYRRELESRYLIAQPQGATLDRVMNKESVAAAAAAAGIRVPRSVTIRRPEEISLAGALSFPCICKPLYASQWRRPEIWPLVGRQKALKVNDFNELETFYASFSSLDPVVNVQEWVEGGEECLQIFGAYRARAGDELSFFTARKRLQYPPLAGTGIAVEAVRMPHVVEPSRNLLRELEFTGICEIEYKQSTRDGELYLIEINPRHWDQHGLGCSVDVDLSEALYRDLTGQPAVSMQQAAGRVMWLAEPEFARHALRCATGRAPLTDLGLAFGRRRSMAIMDRRDLNPFLHRLGIRVGVWQGTSAD